MQGDRGRGLGVPVQGARQGARGHLYIKAPRAYIYVANLWLSYV